MKCRIRVKKEEGIALVITLVMLAVVTVMAIVFLAVTRRERSSVKMAEETAIAKDMADAAMERAKAEAIAGMNAAGSKLHYDIFNSQTFYNPKGFDRSKGRDNTNVGPVRDWPSIRRSSPDDYLQLLGNLQYDPAVPVNVKTNENDPGDLRFYLDFNRNRQFETNGMLFTLDRDEQPIVERIGSVTVTNRSRFVGDPEWIGVLERPDFPHSETNRFVGRMAYLVLPAGKSLDLNFMHNAVNGPAQLDVLGSATTPQPGFSRSQGVGSWEINLAAFLKELNTNTYSWGPLGPQGYQYSIQLNQAPLTRGAPFADARQLLAFRYKRPDHLDSVFQTVGLKNMLNPVQDPGQGTGGFQEFRQLNANNAEDFGDRPYLSASGELFFPPNQAPLDADDATSPGWPGSYVTNAFTDLQQLFNPLITEAGFQARLQNPGLRRTQTGKSSYDRYTVYRMAAQLGTDSAPALEGKIHLNFKNPIGEITNSVIPWMNAVEFFTNAAELMLRASIDETEFRVTGLNLAQNYDRPPGTNYYKRIGDTLVRQNFSISNIQVEARNPYPGMLPFMTQNEYTPTVHRILQVAANIWDNMNDKVKAGGPTDPANPAYRAYPTVFVPDFYKTNNSVIITGWREAHESSVLTRPWADLTVAATNSGVADGPLTNVNFYGQHFVIGAKKGHPNFNELSMQASVDISRKLSVTKASETSTNLVSTNQMFLVSMNHRWGIEAWNSYRTNYKGPLRIFASVDSDIALHDTNLVANNSLVYRTNISLVTQPAILLNQDWIGATQLVVANFEVPFDQFTNILNERSYSTNRFPRFGLPNSLAEFGTLERTPQFVLYTTNKVRFWIIDTSVNRIIDFVSFDKLSTAMNLGREMFRQGNPQSGSSLVNPTARVNENMFWDPTPIGPNSPFTVGHSNQFAVSSGEIPEADTDAFWRPYSTRSPDKRGGVTVWRQIMGLPFRTGIDDPDRVAPRVLTHQAPFTPTKSIRWTVSWQVDDPLVHYMHEDLPTIEDRKTFAGTLVETNWNIGRLNAAYRPWGGNPTKVPTANDTNAFNVGLKDPGIRSSDDWQFPVSRRDARNNPGNTNNFYFYPNIGTLGQVHRGTAWQTLYLKSIYWRNPDQVDPKDGGGLKQWLVTPKQWIDQRGSIGNFPTRDWRLLDVFTTAPNENAARGLLSVNQTNTAAWSAVLGGVVVAKTAVTGAQNSVVPADQGFDPAVIEPGSPQMEAIVRSVIEARTNQYNIVLNPNRNPSDPNGPYLFAPKTNRFGQAVPVFEHLGDVLGAPSLTVQNPYLRGMLGPFMAGLVNNVWNDQAVEFIPQQILSLLQRDEPRFVVYAFGQSLKPAPRSLTSDPQYYHMCTNYQIMGEVITKTTFRVEGQPYDPRTPMTRTNSLANPLRPVVEKYEILPPPE